MFETIFYMCGLPIIGVIIGVYIKRRRDPWQRKD